jgi:hypothetical protein
MTDNHGREIGADEKIATLAHRRAALEADIKTPTPELSRGDREARTNRIVDEITKLEDGIARKSAEGARGVAIKLRIAFEGLAPSKDQVPGRLALSALADLDRMADAGAGFVSSAMLTLFNDPDCPVFEALFHIRNIGRMLMCMSDHVNEDDPDLAELVAYLGEQLAGHANKAEKFLEAPGRAAAEPLAEHAA